MGSQMLVIMDDIKGGEQIAVDRLINAIKNNRLVSECKYLILKGRVGSQKRFSFLKNYWNYYSKAQKSIKHILSGATIDYVLVSDYLWALAAISVKSKKTKLIFLFHGLKSVPFVHFTDVDYRQVLIKILERISWMLSDAITVPSNEGVSCIKKNIIFNKNKMFLVPNIVPKSFFVRRIPHKKKQFNILYSGRIGINKGLENLIEAFTKLNIVISNTKLIIAYPSTSADKKVLSIIKNNSKKNSLDKNLNLIADLNQKELINLYRESNVLVLPSVIEFAPLSVLESLANGTPVVATNVGNVESLLS